MTADITMDVASNQHSHRRRYRAPGSLNHFSLAPLTTRLPLHDMHPDDYDAHSNPMSAPPHTTSYLQGKSAPTTPRLLSRSPGGGGGRRSGGSRRASSRARGTSVPAGRMPKSKSTTQLVRDSDGAPSSRTGGAARRRNNNHKHSHSKDLSLYADYSDWLQRAGALISSEARDSKGQGWLVSRASSTSLAGGLPADPADSDDDDRAYWNHRDRQQRWHASSASAAAAASRRGSAAGLGLLGSPARSRLGSRSHSRVGGGRLTPGERRASAAMAAEDYFLSSSGAGRGDEQGSPAEEGEEGIHGPDFIYLNEKLEAIERDTSAEDEAHVRRLLRRGNGGLGGWIANMFGIRLFSLQDDDDDEDDESDSDSDEESRGDGRQTPDCRRSPSAVRLEGLTSAIDSRVPPPKSDEGGWYDDAAWLLSVAARVIF